MNAELSSFRLGQFLIFGFSDLPGNVLYCTQKSVPQHFLIYKGVSIDIAERSVENILKVLVNTVTNQRSVSIDIALKRWPTLFLLCVMPFKIAMQYNVMCKTHLFCAYAM